MPGQGKFEAQSIHVSPVLKAYVSKEPFENNLERLVYPYFKKKVVVQSQP
jgi:hypothetical protein